MTQVIAQGALQTRPAAVTIKKCDPLSFPKNSQSIVASAPPTLNNAMTSISTTITGWSTTVKANDLLEINLDSVATVTRLVLQLNIMRV